MNGQLNLTVNSIAFKEISVKETIIRVTIGKNSVESAPSNNHVNVTLSIDCKDVSPSEKATIMLLEKANTVGQVTETFSNLVTKSVVKQDYELTGKKTKGSIKANISISWNESKKTVEEPSKANGKKEVVTAAAPAAAAASDDKKPEQQAPKPSLTLTSSVSERPWYLRVSYYYDTTKNVYGYTTSFPLINRVARFSENSANYVLSKIGVDAIKSTHEIDNKLIPLLQGLDKNVDARVSVAIDRLSKGQSYLLETKDKALTKVSEAASSTKKTVSSAKDKAVDEVAKVANYTVGTAVQVKQKTTDFVVSTSSSTYKTVSGAAVYLISHVPIVGKRIIA